MGRLSVFIARYVQAEFPSNSRPLCIIMLIELKEDFRRRGLAKMLAGKLMRQGPGDFADDGWSSADVAPDNMGSRGMCKSLKGTPHWEVSW